MKDPILNLKCCLMFLLFFVFNSQVSFAEEITANSIQTFSEWKAKNDSFLKGCASESNTQKRILKTLHVPTITLNREGVARSILLKYDAIEKMAKAKGLAAIKKSPKAALYTAERVRKTNGFALADDAGLVPEDYLKSFDYKMSCECRYTTGNIAADEAAYNRLTYTEFMKLEERNQLVCFTKSAVI